MTKPEKKRPRLRALGVLSLMLLGVLAVQPSDASDVGDFCDRAARPDPIVGQGAASQLPLHYSLWIPTYAKRCRAAAGTVDYRGTSDSSGFFALGSRPPRAYFIGRDAPLSSDEKLLSEVGLATDVKPPFYAYSKVHQVPMYLTGLAVAYNLNCGSKSVQLSDLVLGLIFSGQITRWNDPLILRDNPANPALATCQLPIHVAVRSDAAAATQIFKDYLGKQAGYWKGYSHSTLVNAWPPSLNVSCKGYGDGGVAGCVIARRGTIGYVGIPTATRMRLRTAAVENASGEFKKPSMSECEAAAASATLPASTTADWSQTTLTYSPRGYPICNFGFVMTFENWYGVYGGGVPTQATIRNVRDYLQWNLSDGVQRQLSTYGYGRLPANALALARAGVGDIWWYCPAGCLVD